MRSFGRVPHQMLRFYSNPWYVNQGTQQAPKEIELPPLPKNAPEKLPTMLTYLAKELGVEDLEILDFRDSDNALGPALLVLGTGKSTAHLGRAAHDFVSHLKNEYGVVAGREGLLTSNFVKLWRRRIRRRQERQRSFAPSVEKDLSLFQKTGSWIVMDTKLDSIYVHLLTQEKRENLDLQELQVQHSVDEEKLKQFDEEFSEPPAVSKSSSTGFGSGRRSFHTATLVGLNNQFASISKTRLLAPATKGYWQKKLFEQADACFHNEDPAPLASIVDAAETQLCAGFTLDENDVHLVLSVIAYYRQAEFESQRVNEDSIKVWRELCDQKSDELLRFYELVFRSSGEHILSDPRYVALLFRTFVAPSQSSVSPAEALTDPKPGFRPTSFIDLERIECFSQIIEANNYTVNPDILMVVMSALLNANMWTNFWRTFDSVSVIAKVDSPVFDAIIAMVVKSGNEKQITHAITRIVPAYFAQQGKIEFSDSLKKSIKEGLQVVDEEEKGHKTLRGLLEK